MKNVEMKNYNLLEDKKMKKTIKSVARVLAVGTAVTCLSSGFVACGATQDYSNTLVISTMNKGYGMSWINALAEDFTTKTGIEVKVFPSVLDGTIDTELNSGMSNADVLFEEYPYWARVESSKTVGGKTYDTLVEDLTDIYKANIPGETETLEEKLGEYVTTEYNVGEKYYHVPWIASMMGIVYNKKVWKDEWKIPRTTNELIALCDTIKASESGVNVPFIYSLKNTYWGSVYATWAAQYEGIYAVNQYNAGYDSEGNRYQPTMVLYDGFERALEVMEVLLKHENGYMHENSIEYSFTDAQVKFLEGDAVMQPNGDWLQTEMSANFSKDEVDIAMMQTPIISCITEKCSVVKTEELLVQVIDYIDGVQGATLPEGLTDNHADVKKIKEARFSVSSSLNYTASIPIYSTKKDYAKQFLQFMYSKQGIETFYESTNGLHLPVVYDYEAAGLMDGATSFLKSTLSLWEKARGNNTLFYFSEKDRIFRGGLLFLKTNMSYPEVYLSAVQGIDRLSAHQIYMKNYENAEAIWDSLYSYIEVEQ